MAQKMSPLEELQDAYNLWKDEMRDFIYVLEAVGKYLDSLKRKPASKKPARAKREDKGDNLNGWNRVIQSMGNSNG